MDETLTLRNGHLVCYRLYDAAEEFDLEAMGPALMEQAVTRAAFRRVKPAHLQVHSPPLQLRMGTFSIKAGPFDLVGELLVRAFETGVVSAGFWFKIPDETSLSALQAPVAALMDNVELDSAAEGRVRKLLAMVGAAAKGPRPSLKVMEEYTVVVARQFNRPITGRELLAHPALPRLLLGETEEGPAISPATRKGALQRALSYYGDDLVVIDWNAAFVFDPRGAEDVADVLEFTTQQLVEFRYYDEYLDSQLGRIYDEVERRARGPSILGGRFSSLARSLMLLRVELTEVTEKIDNSLKLVGEPFLARVYLAAVERFRIHQWRVSVEEKLKVLDNLVALVRGEANTRKTLALETAVVVLILMELFLGLFKMGH
jgi:hypothetical protein